MNTAESRYAESIDLLRSTGYPWGLCEALAGSGMVACYRGETARAAKLFSESLTLSWQQENPLLATSALIGAAGVAAAIREYSRAARLLGAVEAITDALGAPPMFLRDRLVHARTSATLITELGEVALASLRRDGHALSLERAVAEARDVFRSIEACEATAQTAPSGSLTPRELDVLRLLVEGRSNPEIADRLFISPTTARTHVTNILAKLGVATRTEAAAHAVRDNLI